MVGDCATCPLRAQHEHVAHGAGWTAYLGEATHVLRGLESESVDCVITDPPYGTGANTVAGRLSSPISKYRGSGVKSSLPSIAGDAMLPDAWAEMMTSVMAHALRVCRPGADALWFCDWRGYPSLARIAGNAGFGLKGLVVWDKGLGTRPFKNGFRAQSELILWVRKGGPVDRDPPVYLDGVFSHASPRRVHHMTEKPVALMRDLVEICPPGGVVLAPFQGSGTTGVAALQSGRRYIGIECVSEYHAIACKRLKEAEKS